MFTLKKGTELRPVGILSLGSGFTVTELADGTPEIGTSGSNPALNDLTDVTITAPSAGPPAHVLKYNGTQWVNAVLATADLPTLPTHTHPASDITAGTFPTGTYTFSGGKLLIDGTDSTIAAGEVGLAENGGNLRLGARVGMVFDIDNDNNATGVQWLWSQHALASTVMSLTDDGTLSILGLFKTAPVGAGFYATVVGDSGVADQGGLLLNNTTSAVRHWKQTATFTGTPGTSSRYRAGWVADSDKETWLNSGAALEVGPSNDIKLNAGGTGVVIIGSDPGASERLRVNTNVRIGNTGTSVNGSALTIAGTAASSANVQAIAGGRIDWTWYDSAAAADAKRWDFSVDGVAGANTFALGVTRDDAGTAGHIAIALTRSANTLTLMRLLQSGGAVVIGSDPTGSELLRVGGSAHIENSGTNVNVLNVRAGSGTQNNDIAFIGSGANGSGYKLLNIMRGASYATATFAVVGDGSVVIGTDPTGAQLLRVAGSAHIRAGNDELVTITNTNASSSNSGGSILLGSNDGAAQDLDHKLGGINFSAHDGTSFGTHSARIEAYASQLFTSTAHGTRLRFRTTPNGSTTMSVRYEITDAGHLLPGTDYNLDIGSVGARIHEGFFGKALNITAFSEEPFLKFQRNLTNNPRWSIGRMSSTTFRFLYSDDVTSETQRLLLHNNGVMEGLDVNGVSRWNIGQSGTATGFEIGRIDGTAATAFIDFHSGATAVDYDTRIAASGGDGTLANGVVTFSSGTFVFKSGPSAVTRAQIDANVVMYVPVFCDAGGQALNLRAGATSDHVYMGFYADSGAQSTRSAYFGYGAAGGSDLQMVNEMGGDLHFSTTGAGDHIFFVGDVKIDTARLLFGAATSKIVPGATALQIRNNADSATSIHVHNSGNVSLGNTTDIYRLQVTGIGLFDTQTNTTPFTVARIQKTSNFEELRIGLDDANTYFHYINDEAQSQLRFRLQNTDTEAGGGASANDREMLSLFANFTVAEVRVTNSNLIVGGDPGGTELVRINGVLRVKENILTTGANGSVSFDNRTTSGSNVWMVYNQDGAALRFWRGSDVMLLEAAALRPATAALLTLGTATLPWADYYVASGSKVRWGENSGAIWPYIARDGATGGMFIGTRTTSTDTDRMLMTTAAFSPATAGGMALGTATLPWSTTHIQELNVYSGTTLKARLLWDGFNTQIVSSDSSFFVTTTGALRHVTDSTRFAPNTNGGLTLGSSGNMWGSAYLAKNDESDFVQLGTTKPVNLRSYSAVEGDLWVINALGSPVQQRLRLSTGFDNDKQITFGYVPGTVGANSGVLSIGQLAKNNANWTHGFTDFLIGNTRVMRQALTLITSDVDFRINSLGTFDSAVTAPAADQLLSFDGSVSKWRPRTVQLTFNTGVMVATNLGDGSQWVGANSNPTLPADPGTNPGTPATPTVTPVYGGFIIDMGALPPSNELYIVDYSKNGGTFTSNAIICTSQKVVHQIIQNNTFGGAGTSSDTFSYKVRIQYSVSNFTSYSTASTAASFSTKTEVNAFGLIVASQIATVNLAALVADLGVITAGRLQSTGSTPHLITSSMLSHSGLTVFDATLVTNGVTNDTAWGTDSATSGATLQVDLGSGSSAAFVKVHIWAIAAGYAGTYDIEYSDNGSSWTAASTSFTPSFIGKNVRTWASAGAHRYWRIRLTNTPGAGSELGELEFFTQDASGGVRLTTGYTIPAGWSSYFDVPNSVFQVDDLQQVPVTRVKVGKVSTGIQDYGLQVFDKDAATVMDFTGAKRILAVPVQPSQDTGSAITLDLSTGLTQQVRITAGSWTLQLNNPTNGARYRIWMQRDPTTTPAWPTVITDSGGNELVMYTNDTTPVLTTDMSTAGALALYEFEYRTNPTKRFSCMTLQTNVLLPAPQVQGSPTGTSVSTASTTHNITMPSTVNSGDLLLMMITFHATQGTVTTPSGWTAKGATGLLCIFTKTADGTEDGASVDVATANSVKAAALVYRITRWFGNADTGVSTNLTSGAPGTSADPGAVTPGWANDRNLWFAGVSVTGNPAITDPGSYSSFNEQGDGASTCKVRAGRRILYAATENPGAFTWAGSQTWTALTIAVRPPA